MDLSRNEWGPGKEVLKLEAWGFYLFIYLCPALFKKDLRQLMKIHKVERRRINGQAEGEGASAMARAVQGQEAMAPMAGPWATLGPSGPQHLQLQPRDLMPPERTSFPAPRILMCHRWCHTAHACLYTEAHATHMCVHTEAHTACILAHAGTHCTHA